MEVWMRTRTWLFVGMIAVAGSFVAAQTTRQMGALAVRDKAPTDKAIDLTDEELVTVAKAMPGQNSPHPPSRRWLLQRQHPPFDRARDGASASP
jgi:hypothetical protein